jgi:hypothetical protein
MTTNSKVLLAVGLTTVTAVVVLPLFCRHRVGAAAVVCTAGGADRACTGARPAWFVLVIPISAIMLAIAASIVRER